ncbi:MAG TPA: ThuA domain-containing protein [Candidatus Binatia bacterium]|jgi:type 1 glutamine amidotransferase|nr:ThuA domain-containing protein [Candidatus Binatia bacterium]
MHAVIRNSLICILLGIAPGFLRAAEPDRRVLLYTRNQIGPRLYVHDNIAASVEAIQKLGAENNFAVDVSDDPTAFSPANLKKYKAIIFDNTNNEILDNDEQKDALQTYIRAGGGFVGIHSASGSMRQWPWFWSVLGGKFSRHAKLQKFTVRVKDPKDISTAHFPATFEWIDEFYYVDNMPEGLHVLLAGELTNLDDPGKEKYPGKKFGDEFPLAWSHQYDGGREWYTALGHQKEHYSDPVFTKHILGGILWAMGETKGPENVKTVK